MFFNIHKSSSHKKENTSKNKTETTKKAGESAVIEDTKVKGVYVVSETDIHNNDTAFSLILLFCFSLF